MTVQPVPAPETARGVTGPAARMAGCQCGGAAVAGPVITRADYIQRHTDCPSAPQTARVEDAVPGPGGAWLVDYQIDGVQLRDYWFYQHGRWVFDLILSNPSSVRLYKLTPQQYAAAQDCAH